MSGSEVYALRSPAPEPAPDDAEQLVAVRAAIITFRTQANVWREVAGVADAANLAAYHDRRADVLEHVLRRLIDTQRAGARPDDPSAGCAESGGSDPRAATSAHLNDSTSGAPPGPATRQWKSGEKVPASGIYATDRVRQADQGYVAGGRQATLTRGERFPPSPFPWSLVREARHVT